jgi:hypothetical protein
MVPGPMTRSFRPLAALLTLSLALLAGGCRSDCRVLAEKVCDCRPTTRERDDCKRALTPVEAEIDTTAAEEQRCRELNAQCSCDTLETPEGKQACGLAR